jgi:hypothetical protein
VKWIERLAMVAGLASLFSLIMYTVLSPNAHLVLSSALVFIVSVIVLAELRIMRELERLESKIMREIEELLKALEQRAE